MFRSFFFDQRNPSYPEAGLFALRLVKRGVEVAAEISLENEALVSRVNGEPYDPPPSTMAANGVQAIWLFGRRIERDEWEYLVARYRYAKEHDPESVFANPYRSVDLKTMAPIVARR